MDILYFITGGFWNLVIVVALIVLFVKVSSLKKEQKKILEKLNKKDYSLENKKEEFSERERAKGSEEDWRYIIKEKEEGEKRENEYNIGSKILPAVGIISVLFGISFFLKYAFENNLIDETGRVILGFISGIIFIALGNWLRKKYKNYASLLMGGGFAILYLASKFGLTYELYGNILAFILMMFITATAVLWAYKANSKIVALVSLLGGFLVPILVASNTPNELVLFNYILILLAGMFFLAWKKNWTWLVAGSALGTISLYGGSFGSYYTNEVFSVYWVYLIIFFGVFTVAPFLYYLRMGLGEGWQKWTNILLPIISGGIFMFLSYWMFQRMAWGEVNYGDFREVTWEGGIPFFKNIYFVVALIPAIFYLTMSKISLKRFESTGDRKLIYYFISLSTFAIALIPALQFSGKWVTFAWLVEALVLALLSWKSKDKVFLNISLFVSAVAFWRLLTEDLYLKISSYSEILDKTVIDFVVILNDRAFIVFSSVVVSFIIAYVALKMQRKKVAKILAIIGNLIFLLWIYLELKSSFQAKYISEDAFLILWSIFYMLYAAILMFIGVIKKYINFRMLSLFIFTFVIAKAYLFDIWELSELIRILAFIILGLVALGVGYYYSRNSEKIKKFLKD